MTLKASNSHKIPTLQQNTVKGLGSRTCRIGKTSKSLNRGGIELFSVLNISTFMHEQHLFSCVNPLLLCYRVLNMGRVAILFDVFWPVLRL